MKLFCTCRAVEVTHSDYVDLRGGIVSVHGLHHCYNYPVRAYLTEQSKC